jgi:hypothetical protein
MMGAQMKPMAIEIERARLSNISKIKAAILGGGILFMREGKVYHDLEVSHLVGWVIMLSFMNDGGGMTYKEI